MRLNIVVAVLRDVVVVVVVVVAVVPGWAVVVVVVVVLLIAFASPIAGLGPSQVGPNGDERPHRANLAVGQALPGRSLGATS